MAEVNPGDGAKRFRSPPYPALSLSKAIERTKELHTKALHHPVGIKVLADAWEYGVKSSGLWATAAALLQFGLLSDEGTGDKRKFTLTEGAVRIVRDPNPGSEKRRELLKQAALAPKIFKELWESYGPSVNTLSDVVLKSHLTVDRQDHGLASYSDNAAEDVIRVFKETVAFAGLTDSDTVPEPAEEKNIIDEADLASFAGGSEPKMEQAGVTKVVPLPPGGADMSVLLQGNRLKINAVVDADGIARLKQVLDKYEEILKLLQ